MSSDFIWLVAALHPALSAQLTQASSLHGHTYTVLHSLLSRALIELVRAIHHVVN